MDSPSPLDRSALALASAGPDLRPTGRDAWGPGVGLALLAHALLVAALAWGVSWRSHQEEAVQAELWASVPEAEAPPPVAVTPPPAPTPPPRVETPPAPTEESVPDLVIDKKKATKAERKRREVESFDSTPPKPRKTEPDPKQLKDKLAKEKAEKDKAEKEKAEKADRAKAEKDKADKAKADKEAKAAKDAEAKAQAAALEAQRQRNLSDILRRAGGGQNPSATGQGTRNATPSAGYIGRLRALFKRNLTWAFDDTPGNPETVVEVSVAADGAIMARNIVQRSGLPAWDEAVLRAIDRTEVLPADESGKVPSKLTLSFKMKDY